MRVETIVAAGSLCATACGAAILLFTGFGMVEATGMTLAIMVATGVLALRTEAD